MGIADANYKISYIKFGTNKRISDGGVIQRADFREKIGSQAFKYATDGRRSRDSSVGISTRYRLDGPGSNSVGERDFPQPSKPALRPNQPPIQWVPSLSRGLSGRGRGADQPPHLVPRLTKE